MPKRKSKAAATWVHPGPTIPARVAMVSLGVSSRAWMLRGLSKSLAPNDAFDEVWTCNRGIRYWRHDVAFVMDDLRGEARDDWVYGAELRAHDKVIVTSCAYPEFETSVSYPLAEVVQCVGREHAYFRNSIPFVVAYACYIGVSELVLFGCDYTRADGTVMEAERANVEYWVAVARSRGLRVGVPQGSTLLANNEPTWFYGYRCQPDLDDLSAPTLPDGGAS